MIDKLILEHRDCNGSRVISVRIKEELIARVDDLAEATGRSRNELFSVLLKFAIDNCEIKK